MIRRGIGRVGRPGLVRTVGRTAVIAGTASAVSGGVARRQQRRSQEQAEEYQEDVDRAAAEQQAAAPPPPPPPPPGGAAAPTAGAPGTGITDENVEQLKKLAELKDQGILSEEEFAAKKARILGI